MGLHRAESVKQNLDMRRRLWAACVISDRWCSLAYGHPFMIDVEDCDVRLTSSDAIEDMYMNELLKLSILLGRVLKMIYRYVVCGSGPCPRLTAHSPSGLVLATDEGLQKLLADIDNWDNNLPAALQYCGVDSSQRAGLLHLFYSCVCMLFWRVFMRISYTVPAHLKFALSIERWTFLVRVTREAIDWLDGHERMYDVWMLVSYCATSCAIVQVRDVRGRGVRAERRACSTIRGRGARTPRRRRRCASCATASSGGRARCRRTTDRPGARWGRDRFFDTRRSLTARRPRRSLRCCTSRRRRRSRRRRARARARAGSR